MENIEHQYIAQLKQLLRIPADRPSRPGIHTASCFGAQLIHDMDCGFPLLTTKKINYKAIFHELLWFISGSENIKYLNDNGVHIWDKWADKRGNVGPLYGSQWRFWPIYEYHCFDDTYESDFIDQIQEVMVSIINAPYSRRHIISSWNVSQLDDMALAPCHVMQQYYVNGNKLDLQVYQRSGDIFLGVPFNIASYALLLQMICIFTSYWPGRLIFTFGDLHLYSNHIEQAQKQIQNEILDCPYIGIDQRNNINDFVFEDIHLYNYKHAPAIPAPVAV